MNEFFGKDDCLIGNIFKAQCIKPNINKDKFEIKLKRKAICEINKESEYLSKIKLERRLKGFNIHSKKGDQLINREELICFNSSTEDKEIHERSTGQHICKAFEIKKVYDDPASCFINIRTSLNYLSELRSQIEII